MDNVQVEFNKAISKGKSGVEPIIPSEARLYSGSIDLFRGGGGHGPPLYPATSLAIAYQTRSEHLPSL